MDYLKLLEYSFNMEQEDNCSCGKHEFLSDNIFNFVTYDGGMSSVFGEKALEVCVAIENRTTFDYQSDDEDYEWYLIMVNMPFFQGKLEWGTSIRGAWWGLYGKERFNLSSCGLWEDNKQILDLSFNDEQWSAFIKAMNEFVAA